MFIGGMDDVGPKTTLWQPLPPKLLLEPINQCGIEDAWGILDLRDGPGKMLKSASACWTSTLSLSQVIRGQFTGLTHFHNKDQGRRVR